MTSQSIPAQPALGGRKALIGALILGAIAAGLIVAFLASRSNSESPSAANVDTLEVVVATREIAVGTRLDETMVRLKPIPKSAVISDPFLALDAVIGEQTRFPLQANEQLAVGRLLKGSSAQTLSVQIPPGLRGFTISVSTNNSPAALLAPGDFVDVIVSAELVRLGSSTAGTAPATLASDEKPKAAITLLQNVQVLSVQRNFVNNGVVYDSSTRGEPVGKDDDVGYVTLAVTPEQAQLIWLAVQEGKITLSLRAFGDDTVGILPPVAEPIRIAAGTN